MRPLPIGCFECFVGGLERNPINLGDSGLVEGGSEGFWKSVAEV